MSDDHYKISILICIQVIICVCLLVGLLRYLGQPDNYEIAEKINEIITDSKHIPMLEDIFHKLKSLHIYAIIHN